MPNRTTVINGIEYEEMGPYCQVCHAHMGRYYNEEAVAPGQQMFINPHNYESYEKNTCPECGQEYYYDEGNVPYLDPEVLEFMKQHNLKKLEQKGEK